MSPTLNIEIAAGSDDASAQDGSGTGWATSDVSAKLGRDWGNYFVQGLRFTGLNIPMGATIDVATLKMKSYASDSATPVNVKIRAEDGSTPATFSTWADFDGRTWVGTESAWAGVAAWTVDTWYEGASYDVKDTLQAVVNSRAVTDLALRLDDDGSGQDTRIRRFYHKDFWDPDVCAWLHVEYSVGGGGGFAYSQGAVIG